MPDSGTITRFNNFQARAQWVVKGYEALQSLVTRDGLPTDTNEAFMDFADALGMNHVIPRLRIRAEDGASPTPADVDDLHAAELRIPILLRASDALRAKLSYGSKAEELRFLTDLTVAAVDEMIAEARLSTRVTPWTYLAITLSLSATAWLLGLLINSYSKSRRAPAVQVP
jgi:hypothetical protein